MSITTISTTTTTAAATTQTNVEEAIRKAQEALSNPALRISGILIFAGTTAISAALFTPIGAMGGAIYGLSYFATNHSVAWICEKLNYCPDNIIFKITQFVLPMLAGFGAGIASLSLLSYPITVTSALMITAGGFAVAMALGAVGCCAALPAIAAYAYYQSRQNP